jgi:hypothetical protein
MGLLRVRLERHSTSEQGTKGLGKIQVYGKTFFTLELPWKDNKSNVSCIPEGVYKVRWSLSPRLKKYTYEILGVPERAGIRIHSGNLAGSLPYLTHSLGCPLLGTAWGRINGQLAILNSRKAVRDFERLLNKQTFELEIVNV